jgi:hypothetical protein
MICAGALYATSSARTGIDLGLGLDYTPIVQLSYIENPNLDYEIVDNVTWQGRAFCNFGNGFRAGGLFEIYNKSLSPGGFSVIDLSAWGVGLVGDYAYDITESGNTLLVAGMETGYGELTQKASDTKKTAGSVWIGGLGGIRFLIAFNVRCEVDYRITFLEYEIKGAVSRKYSFSGSSLRLVLEYPVSFGGDAKE